MPVASRRSQIPAAAGVVPARSMVADPDLLLAILDSLPVMVGYWDRDLCNRMATTAYVEWFGRTAEEMPGIHIRDLLGPELYEVDLPHMERALAGEKQLFDRTVVDGRSASRHTHVSYIPDIADGEVQGFFALLTDVTAERRAAAVGRALRAIATLIASNASVEEVVSVVAARMHDVFAFEQAAVIRFDGPQRARVIGLDPPLPGFDREIEFGPDDATAAGIVARTGTAAVTAYGPDSAGTAAFLYASGLRSGAAAPIRVHGRLWGAVSLGARNPDAVDRDVVDRLSSFAEMVEIAIGSAAAWSELTRQATTDPITGLPNHRSFHEHLARELAETKRTNRPLSVVLLDLDHFKRVNDTFGHPVGDRIIGEVGRRLDRVKREHEIVARIGGEEFAWLLPETDAEEAYEAAERARRVIADEPFDEVGTLTISAGVCDLSSTRDYGDLIEDADKALYAAKRAGRNRTVSTGDN
jgi:diguanylate cyclase (GGDEF)-like protein/PAS domain S-box-containing protein